MLTLANLIAIIANTISQKEISKNEGGIGKKHDFKYSGGACR